MVKNQACMVDSALFICKHLKRCNLTYTARILFALYPVLGRDAIYLWVFLSLLPTPSSGLLPQLGITDLKVAVHTLLY